MTRAAKTARVLFIEEPVFEAVPRAELGLTKAEGGVVVVKPVLPEASRARAADVQARLLDALLARVPRRLTTLWYYTPMALEFTRHLRGDLVVFDKMDELSAFKGAPADLLDLEQELMDKADLVFTGGASLYEATVGRHAHVHQFASSIDTAHFGAARKGLADPEDQARLDRPRLGFFGVIDERMDVELVGRVAAARPDWNFVMLGPVVKIDPAVLPRLPNLHWLGRKSYSELPSHLANWDLGFMPFAINEATRFISPTKTPEFLAAGLPVVSTPIVDVVRPYGREGLVSIAGTAEEVVASAERLLARGRDKSWLNRVDRKLASGSWDKTWQRMAELMKGAMGTDRAVGFPASSRPGKEVARV